MMKLHSTMMAAVLIGGVCLQGSLAFAEGYSNNSQQYDTTNTGQNKQNTLTPMDQSNADSDAETTRRIRDSVTDDENLSTNAHNVKIITNGGSVTLIGPVDNEQEHIKIVKTAKEIAGANRVVDQIKVSASTGK